MSSRRHAHRTALALLLAALPLAPTAAHAQQRPPRDSAARAARQQRPPRLPTHFYDTSAVVELTLTANFHQLFRDRKQDSPWRWASLAYRKPDGSTVTVPLRTRTRGIFRLKRCDVPPLRLDFARDSVKGTLFEGLDRPRLVNSCRDNDLNEQYLLQEHQLYRVQALVMPLYLRSRLVRMTYVDSASGKREFTRYAMILEEDDALARRVGAKVIDAQGAGPDRIDHANTASFALFQYLIGNTDWSIWGLHNVILLAKDSTMLAVPYDYDFAGAIDAPYATPDPKLPIKSVRQRLYRGFCATQEQLPDAIELFQQKRPAIEALYKDETGRLLKGNLVRRTLDYFDEFYRIVSDPRSLQREMLDVCLPTG
jgi:hypothetical protein